MNVYIKKYIKAIKSCQNDSELADVIDNIYNDGFDDGINSEREIIEQEHSENKLASQFLEKTGSNLEIRFLKHDLYFPSDKEKRDIFECKLSRGSREFVFTFGNSIAEHEKMICEITREQKAWYAQRIIDECVGVGDMAYFKARRYKDTIEKMKEWSRAGELYRPTAYSILAGLEGYCYYDNVDDFANDFGYTKPSEAMRTFEAVKKQAEELQKLYNDEELEELASIQ
jgi:hypothetical protein